MAHFHNNNINMSLIFLTLVTVVVFGLLILGVTAELPRFEHPPKDDGSLSVMVVGDWGRRGTHNQSQVALQMGKAAENLEVDFIISTGDNFYDDGLTNVNDIAFDESFSNIYTAPSLQKKWYSVLGNHDYRGDVLAQLSPILAKSDSKWFCMRSYIVNTEIAEFFFIDTTPFREAYFTDPEDHTYDWRGVLPREKYIESLLDDLDEALRESKAKWKIVVGHHTIRSASDHGDTTELVDELLPVLQANNVHLYVNGHDHCLQHISSPDSALQFLTSGGGSKAWRGVYNWKYPEQMRFFYDGQGFMTLQITQNDIHVAFYDVSGTVLYKWSVINPSHAMI